MRLGLTTIVIAVLASAAMAAPELVWEAVDGGFIFSVSDAESASWAVNLDFTPAAQIQAFGSLNVNTETEANTYEPIDPGYTKAMDSWIYGDWNALATGINGLPGEPMHIHAGTPGGQAFGTKLLAYIASDEVVCWEGVIARQGVDYATSGCTPEPATMALLGLGGLVALRRRR
jgi:PEP-CTERM motif-containing protein